MNFLPIQFEYIPYELHRSLCKFHEVRKIVLLQIPSFKTNLYEFGTEDEIRLGIILQIIQEYIAFPYIQYREADIEPQIRIQAQDRIGEIIQVLEEIDFPIVFDFIYDALEQTLTKTFKTLPSCSKLTKEDLANRDFCIDEDDLIGKTAYATMEDINSLLSQEESLDVESTPTNDQTVLYFLLERLGIIDCLGNNWMCKRGEKWVPITDVGHQLGNVLGSFCGNTSFNLKTMKRYVNKAKNRSTLTEDIVHKVDLEIKKLNIVPINEIQTTDLD